MNIETRGSGEFGLAGGLPAGRHDRGGCARLLHVPQLDAVDGPNILEVPSSPREGISLEVLAYALQRSPIQACIVIANFSNPLGSLMPNEKKRELVQLLARHDVPLIEDDVYGDLGFAPVRPPAAKAYDEQGQVLLRSSRKPYRPATGWGGLPPGDTGLTCVERLKSLLNIATASPTQLAIAEFLANGGYDHHLRSLRRTCAARMAHVRDAIGRYFPQGTCVTRPEGGTVLWVEMPEQVDARALYQEALRAGIAIAPGALFTTGANYRNCFRLNATFWSDRIDKALRTLGELAGTMV